jgi:hypothetical protein
LVGRPRESSYPRPGAWKASRHRKAPASDDGRRTGQTAVRGPKSANFRLGPARFCLPPGSGIGDSRKLADFGGLVAHPTRFDSQARPSKAALCRALHQNGQLSVVSHPRNQPSTSNTYQKPRTLRRGFFDSCPNSVRKRGVRERPQTSARRHPGVPDGQMAGLYSHMRTGSE